MKVLAISGGSLNGSNDSMAKEALMGAKEQGAEIEFIRLLDADLKPCTGCIACVNSLMQGGNGDCVIKDDFNWIKNKILDADGVIFAMPIFEKGTPGSFRTLQDRLCGPAGDTGMNFVAGKIAEQTGKGGPDPRKMKPKVVSFIAIGGSDWGTRASCDMNLAAMSPMWKVIDDLWIPWAKSVIIQDEHVKACHKIGVDIAIAAGDMDNAKYVGVPGVCSVCNSRNFYIHTDGVAECEVCGIRGKLESGGVNGMTFTFDKEQLEHSHTGFSGKMKHIDDIKENEGQLVKDKQTPEYKKRVEKYKAFIQATKPE